MPQIVLNSDAYRVSVKMRSGFGWYPTEKDNESQLRLFEESVMRLKASLKDSEGPITPNNMRKNLKTLYELCSEEGATLWEKVSSSPDEYTGMLDSLESCVSYAFALTFAIEACFDEYLRRKKQQSHEDTYGDTHVDTHGDTHGDTPEDTRGDTRDTHGDTRDTHGHSRSMVSMVSREPRSYGRPVSRGGYPQHGHGHGHHGHHAHHGHPAPHPEPRVQRGQRSGEYGQSQSHGHSYGHVHEYSGTQDRLGHSPSYNRGYRT